MKDALEQAQAALTSAAVDDEDWNPQCSVDRHVAEGLGYSAYLP